MAALRLSRQILAVDFEQAWIELTLVRICSDLIQVEISAICIQIDLDPRRDPMDRSNCASNRSAAMAAHAKLVHQERRFYFVGHTNREVIFTTLATSLEDAWQRFRASGKSDSDALFIIKTETEIYLL